MRNLDQDLFEQVQAQMEQPTFLERASERMWKCEGLFAESKQNHCLARAKYRGRPKVQIQAYLCAIVQNLKRLLFPLYCWLALFQQARSFDEAVHAPMTRWNSSPVGAEHPSESSGTSDATSSGAAESAAVDAELAIVIDAWESLGPEMRSAIVDIVRTTAAAGGTYDER